MKFWNYSRNPAELSVEILQREEEDGVVFWTLTFIPRVIDGVPTRIAACYGFPAGSGRNPAVLHIHGGSQTLSRDHIRYWARRGYSCLSYDWTGPLKNRPFVSDLGLVDFSKAAMPGPENKLQNSRLYNIAAIAGAAITVMAGLEHTDSTRMGAYGISWGATGLWVLGGVDSRLKALAMVYGCGGLFEEGHSSGNYAPAIDPVELAAFRRRLGAERYAPRMQAPVFMLHATNDFWGFTRKANEIYGQVRQEKRIVFTPYYNHYIDPNAGQNVALWMDHYLQGAPPPPATPAVDAVYTDGVVKVQISQDREAEVVKTDLYYSYGDFADRPSPLRHWNHVECPDGAALIHPREAGALKFFATVRYADGWVLSSPLGDLRTPGPETPLSPPALLDDFSGEPEWGNAVGIGHTDFVFRGIRFLRCEENGMPLLTYVCEQPDRVLKTFSFFTFRPSEENRKPYGLNATLSFYFKGTERQSLAVELIRHTGLRSETVWRAQAAFTPGNLCQIRLRREDFQYNRGVPLSFSDWSQVDAIQICGKTEPGSVPLIGRLTYEF